jgi:hypothetical protein
MVYVEYVNHRSAAVLCVVYIELHRYVLFFQFLPFKICFCSSPCACSRYYFVDFIGCSATTTCVIISFLICSLFSCLTMNTHTPKGNEYSRTHMAGCYRLYCCACCRHTFFFLRGWDLARPQPPPRKEVTARWNGKEEASN